MSLRDELKDHEFFKSLPPEYFDFVIDCASAECHPAGSFLFREGHKADQFFYIVRGKVALENHIPGREVILFETVPKAHVVGWSWLVYPHFWVFDGRAVREVEAISFDGEKIRQKAEEDHDFGFYFYRYFAQIMTRRVLSSRMQLMDVYSNQEGSEYL